MSSYLKEERQADTCPSFVIIERKCKTSFCLAKYYGSTWIPVCAFLTITSSCAAFLLAVLTIAMSSGKARGLCHLLCHHLAPWSLLEQTKIHTLAVFTGSFALAQVQLTTTCTGLSKQTNFALLPQLLQQPQNVKHIKTVCMYYKVLLSCICSI